MAMACALLSLSRSPKHTHARAHTLDLKIEHFLKINKDSSSAYLSDFPCSQT